MNRRKHWSQGVLGFGLLVLLASSLALLFRHIPSGVSSGQAKATIVELAQAVATQPNFPLTNTLPIGTVFPTEMPFPTFTSLPTPTLHPVLTATPIPLPSSAVDASGSIFYAVRTKLDVNQAGYTTKGHIYQAQVDAKGEIASQPKPLDLDWIKPYLSWDRSFVAFINTTMAGDRVSIVNPRLGEIKPIKTPGEIGGVTSFFLGWHPSDQELLYRVERSTYGGLWLVNVETEQYTIVVQQDPLYIYDAASSPDGQRIAYVQQKGLGAPAELRIIFATGGESKLLLSDGQILGLSWSPDNKKLAFIGGQGLCVLNLDGSVCKIVAKDLNVGQGFESIWSPDSHYLAYITFDPNLVPASLAKQSEMQDPDKEAFIGANIHVVNVETGKETVSVNIEPSDQISGHIDPTWSPDGKMLAFAALTRGQAGIWVVNIDGTGLRQIAEAPDLIRFPVWTR